MTRRATVRTEVADPETVAAALVPDNTEEMETTVDGDRVVTRIERETTGGLQSTVDDYVANLDVATDVVATATQYRQRDDADSGTDAAAAAGSVDEPDTHDTNT